MNHFDILGNFENLWKLLIYMLHWKKKTIQCLTFNISLSKKAKVKLKTLWKLANLTAQSFRKWKEILSKKFKNSICLAFNWYLCENFIFCDDSWSFYFFSAVFSLIVAFLYDLTLNIALPGFYSIFNSI